MFTLRYLRFYPCMAQYKRNEKDNTERKPTDSKRRCVMKTAKSLNWIIAIGGVWEILAPFLLSYSKATTAMWDAIIIGLALVILGAWAGLANESNTVKSLSWVNAVLGLWLVIAPFILAYSGVAAAMWNDVIVGIIVLVLGVWAAQAFKE